jgi:rhodanese-related sulfurtransferase
MNAAVIALPVHRHDRAPDEGGGEVARAILHEAAERGREQRVPYAGLVTPREAHRLFVDGLAAIVDVRTRPEWEFVGHVEDTPLIEWRPYGAAAPDPRFVDRLAARFARDSTILFLCRSGVRSHHAAAAAAQAGFTRAFNILEGFEGDLDDDGRRGSRGGWRHAGLPWAQG